MLTASSNTGGRTNSVASSPVVVVFAVASIISVLLIVGIFSYICIKKKYERQKANDIIPESTVIVDF